MDVRLKFGRAAKLVVIRRSFCSVSKKRCEGLRLGDGGLRFRSGDLVSNENCQCVANSRISLCLSRWLDHTPLRTTSPVLKPRMAGQAEKAKS
jgi:hypothetical protein